LLHAKWLEAFASVVYKSKSVVKPTQMKKKTTAKKQNLKMLVMLTTESSNLKIRN
jgi:hypothetical protein